MNREDIIRMAREAFIKRGFWPNEVMWECWKDAWLHGASTEREACAKVCDRYVNSSSDHEAGTAMNLQDAIRARGQA